MATKNPWDSAGSTRIVQRSEFFSARGYVPQSSVPPALVGTPAATCRGSTFFVNNEGGSKIFKKQAVLHRNKCHNGVTTGCRVLIAGLQQG